MDTDNSMEIGLGRGVGGERAGPGGGREREKKVETTVTE